MLSSAIKSNAFITYKELFLQDDNLERKKGTLFLPKVIVTEMCFTNLSLEVSQ